MSNTSSGENNPMYGKSVKDVWVLKYGEEIAEEKEITRKQNISRSIKGDKNPMYGKPTPLKSGNGISGKYKDLHFRSLRELNFILICERFGLNIRSAESIRIPYIKYDKTNRTYSPDFIVNEKYMVELKPNRLINSPLVMIKTAAARNYCSTNNLIYKIIDIGVPPNYKLIELIDKSLLKFSERNLKRIYEYKD